MENKEIIKGIEKQELKSIKNLIDKFGGLIYGVIDSKLTDYESYEKDDCFDRIIFSLWNDIKDFQRQNEDLASWILSVSKFIVEDSKHKHTEGEIDTNDAQETVLTPEERDILTAVINKLEEMDRKIYTRKFLYNESVENISRQLKLPKELINSRLCTVKDKLKLFSEGYNHETNGQLTTESRSLSEQELNGRYASIVNKITTENLEECVEVANGELENDEKAEFKFRGTKVKISELTGINFYKLWAYNMSGIFSTVSSVSNYLVYLTDKRMLIIDMDSNFKLVRVRKFGFDELYSFSRRALTEMGIVSLKCNNPFNDGTFINMNARGSQVDGIIAIKVIGEIGEDLVEYLDRAVNNTMGSWIR